MRNLILTLALLTGIGSIAQEKSGDTTRFKFGNTEFIIIDGDTTMVSDMEEPDQDDASNDLAYWSGFDVGVNVLMNSNFQNSFNSSHLDLDPGQSFAYHFNFAEKRIPIVKEYVGIVTGLGFTNSRFGFNDNRMRLGATSDSTFGYQDTTLVSGFNKNQLRANYFNIPVLLNFNTSKYADKNFHIALGVVGGVRIGSNVRYKYDVLGGERKDKEKGKYNLNPFQLIGTARIGYKDFGLFANYNLLPLFQEGKSEQAFPFTVGASFHF